MASGSAVSRNLAATGMGEPIRGCSRSRKKIRVSNVMADPKLLPKITHKQARLGSSPAQRVSIPTVIPMESACSATSTAASVPIRLAAVKYPVITAFVGIAVNLAVAFASVGKMGVYGLALGTVCSAIVMAVMLLLFAGRLTKGLFNRAVFYGILKDLVGAMALFIAARELRILLEQSIGGALGTAVGLIAGLLAGLVAYGLVLWLLGSKELRALLQLVKKNENN